MTVACPVSTSKVLNQLVVLLLRVQMPLSLAIVVVPISEYFLFEPVNGCRDGKLNFFHINFEVSPFLLQLIVEIQSFLLELICQFISVGLQFQALDVDPRIILEVNQLVFDFLPHISHIFIFVLVVKKKLVIVPGDTELTTYPLGAELAQTDYFFRQVMSSTFQDTLHLCLLYPIDAIYWTSCQLFEQMKSFRETMGLQNHERKDKYADKMNSCEGRVLKILPALLLTVGFGIYRIVYQMDLTSSCFRDAGHELLFPLNRLMDRDPDAIITLVGQLLMDGSILFTMLWWLLFLKNMRYPIAACFFYVARTLSLHIFLLPFPKDMAWKSPHFPSLMVPYDRTRDFYFSGHTGIAILILIEVHKLNMPLFAKFLCYFQVFWMIMMLVASRTHYSIDIVGGILFGMLCYDLSEKVVYYSDSFFSLPYQLALKIKQKCCPGESVTEYKPLSDDI